MITCQQLSKIFKSQGLEFFSGVPCSILKDWLNFINESKQFKNIVATCEGEACAIATGYYLATKKIPVVYMQNSGLGNSVDPLTSLLDKEVYSIPALLLISWRGEPGEKDEPQHIKMGKITPKLLKTLGIPFAVLSNNAEAIEKQIKKAKVYLRKKNSPYAIIVRKGIIASHQTAPKKEKYSLGREEAIKIVIDSLKRKEIIISTTGKTSRELFELRKKKKQSHQADFYTLGSMGSTAGIALGIALQKPKKRIFVFDGDGSVLMKMGTLATIGHYLSKNFYHIIFDNHSHESTGGQATVSETINFAKVATACGYEKAMIISRESELKKILAKLNKKSNKGPIMLVIKIRRGARKDLGRPTLSPVKMKRLFMNFLVNKKNYPTLKKNMSVDL